MAQIAIVWVLSKPMVTAPIVGATKIHHAAEAAALEIQPAEDEIRHLEEPHTTRPAYLW